MAAEDRNKATEKPGSNDLIFRLIAAAGGAALGALIAGWVEGDNPKYWGAGWFGPVCAGLGAVLGILIDNMMRGGKDGAPKDGGTPR